MKGTIKFLNDWTQTLAGDLVQGGELAVDYDLSRLTARRDTFRGAAVWDIFALARFQPDTIEIPNANPRQPGMNPAGF